MSAGGDVDQIILALGIERISAGEGIQDAIDLLEIPGITQLQKGRAKHSFRGNSSNVIGDRRQQTLMLVGVEQLEAVDQQIFLLTQRHAGPPFLPAPRAAFIQRGAKKAQYHGLFRCFR